MTRIAFNFKIASEEWEFEQIHRLNYKTFVEEIPQHQPNLNGRLVDKFHTENTYLICLNGRQLVGMAAIRNRRPFSLDKKLDNLDSYLPDHRSICECRLLAVEKDYRKSGVFYGMAQMLAQYGESHGYDLVVMSGTVRQLKLYKHLSFVPFGSLVGTQDAQYQPMYLMLGADEMHRMKPRAHSYSDRPSSISSAPINFLPGPVAISGTVRNVFAQAPASHRSSFFMEMFAHTKHLLCQFTGSKSVEIFSGSGTLANDVIAGQLSLIQKPGLILTNGEFGNRLTDHATRFGLTYQVIEEEWGSPFQRDKIQRLINEDATITWLWAVHCETSSGILNDSALLQEITAEKNIQLCLDCTSSFGSVPTDLSKIYLASSVSGKGLGAFPGLSMVFYNHAIEPAPEKLPRSLDLGLYATCHGVPFTISSNLVYALHAALTHYDPSHFEQIAALSSWLRPRLSELGLRLIGPENQTSPAVITIALPETISSESVGDQLHRSGYLLSYKSKYLLERNWMQICLMGECKQETLASLLGNLRALVWG